MMYNIVELIKDLNDKDFSLKEQGYSSDSKKRIYISPQVA